jgi:O-antigen ligase
MSVGTHTQTFTAGAASVGRWSTIALGAFIPVSIALDNILLAIVLAAWLLGWQFKEKLSLAWQNPVYRAAMLLFGIMLIGTLYGPATWTDARSQLLKYLDLALIPVFGWAYLKKIHRIIGLRVIAGALLLVLTLSYALKAGIIPPNPAMHGIPELPVVFKNRLTHNILMAFAVFLFAWFALTAATRGAKLVWMGAAALAVINMTLMVDGATGYLVLVALMLLLGWQRAGLKGIAISIAFAMCVVFLLMMIPGPFQTRYHQVVGELDHESIDRPASTSTGYRMEFYRNTLSLIQKSPLFGSGTGSFAMSYAEQVKGTGSVASKNPHNDFMLITVQTGVFGLAALLWLFWQQWRLAPLLPTPMERGLAQGLVVMMGITCMLNSALLDHTEGLLYAWLTALLYAGLAAEKHNTSAPA